MAFGSGLSLVSERCSKRKGSPSSPQACNEERASRLHHVSSSKPSTHPGLRSDRPISRSRRLFSSILGVGAGDPPLGPQPAHPLPLQGRPDGLRAHPLLGYALLEARLCGQCQRPKTGGLAQLPRAPVKHLAQAFCAPLLEGDPDLLGLEDRLCKACWRSPSLKRFMAVRAVWGSQPKERATW